jgi:hypothetical protein
MSRLSKELEDMKRDIELAKIVQKTNALGPDFKFDNTQDLLFDPSCAVLDGKCDCTNTGGSVPDACKYNGS